jgi:hypothetical protein
MLVDAYERKCFVHVYRRSGKYIFLFVFVCFFVVVFFQDLHRTGSRCFFLENCKDIGKVSWRTDRRHRIGPFVSPFLSFRRHKKQISGGTLINIWNSRSKKNLICVIHSYKTIIIKVFASPYRCFETIRYDIHDSRPTHCKHTFNVDW